MPKPTTTTTTTTTTRKPKHPKPYKKYTVRIYASDGSYNSELIDEFVFKAANVRGFGGQIVCEPTKELEEFFKQVGLTGYTVDTASGGKLYYPPHRIYYIEAEPKPHSAEDWEDDR